MKAAFYTALALLAFAGNSILCRLALGQQLIDPVTFTGVRLVSGALVLALMVYFKSTERKGQTNTGHRVNSVLALFIYALAFSFAYVSLDTGTGALILFAAVQITMIVAGLLKGQRLLAFELFGLLLAFAGLIYLVLPALGTPSVQGFLMMAAAGVAWGAYSIMGQTTSQPMLETSRNFIWAIPLVVLMVLVVPPEHWTTKGLLLAMFSGMITSALGYVIWYLALPLLKATQAAVVQLLVPVLAALGGLGLAGEPISWRLVQASAVILGGIMLVFWARSHGSKKA